MAAVREEEVEVGKELKGVQAVEEEGAEEQVAEEEGAVREEGVDERTGGDVVVNAVGAPLACLRTFREIDKITAIVGTPVARTVPEPLPTQRRVPEPRRGSFWLWWPWRPLRPWRLRSARCEAL